MSLLESYRKFYQAAAERRERHHFNWTMKKTEEEAEESIYSGGIMSMGGALQGEATRFLAEGIEKWLETWVTVPEPGGRRDAWLNYINYSYWGW